MMGCCILAALIISVVRKAYFAVFPGRKPEVVAFAPAARRLGPGSSIPLLSDDRLQERPDTRLPTAPVAGAIAVGLYVTVIASLRHAGALTTFAAPRVGWTSRDLIMAAIFAGMLLIALGGRRPSRNHLDEWSSALTATGASWTALAVTDMHLFGLFEMSTTGDIAFHGAGLAALFTGLAMRQPPSRPRARVAAPLTQGARR
jgi:hypothetical protein